VPASADLEHVPTAAPVVRLRTLVEAESCGSEVLASDGRAYVTGAAGPGLVELDSTGAVRRFEVADDSRVAGRSRYRSSDGSPTPFVIDEIRAVTAIDAARLWVVAEYDAFVPGPSRLLRSREGELVFDPLSRHHEHVHQMWRWGEETPVILARARDNGPDRLRVLGHGPSPDFRELAKEPACRRHPPTVIVGAVHVALDGPLHAVVRCGERSWLGSWNLGDPHGRFASLAGEVVAGSIASREGDAGWLALRTPEGVRGFRWVGENVESVDMPVDAEAVVGIDPTGRPWLRAGTAMLVFDDGWIREPVPASIKTLDGVQFGTPWVLSAHGTVHVRTAPGRWEQVGHDRGLQPYALVVAGPNEAYIAACHQVGPQLDGIEESFVLTAEGSPASPPSQQQGQEQDPPP
jgi:hypothetical protein